MSHRRTPSQRTREPHQKKQGCKQQKSMRGRPDNPYGELKQPVTLSLTPTARAGLDQMSRVRQISRSELLEQLGQGRLALMDVPQPTVLLQVILWLLVANYPEEPAANLPLPIPLEADQDSPLIRDLPSGQIESEQTFIR